MSRILVNRIEGDGRFMPGLRLAALVRRMRREMPAPAGSSDADLLARFAHAHDDAAFELLVWRHGAMVLAACRRILAHTEDAEDAFQAVFLVLARKAQSVSRGAALPAWLHRVALRAATRLARSRRQIATMAQEPSGRLEPDRVLQAETLGVLDDEVNNLPERFRRAVVLCYLEGLSAAEAARQLGCPTGTVESRLAAARKKLRDRLTRRGVTLPAGILAVAGHAVLTPEVVAQTARASGEFARGGAIANETSIRLAKGVLLMWQTRKWVGMTTIAAALTISAGLGWAKWPDGADLQPEIAAALPTAPEPQAKDEPRVRDTDWPFVQRLSNFGSDSQIVGVTSDGRTLVIRSGQMLYGLDLANQNRREPSFHFNIQNGINDVAVSPDGKNLATAEGIHGVKLRDMATGKVIEAFWPSGKLPAQQVAFTPDSTKLVALSRPGSDPRDFGRGPSSKGAGIPKDPDAKVTTQAQVNVWDLATRKELGHPVESTTVNRIVQKGPSAPRYQLAENGRFVLRTEQMISERKADAKRVAPSSPGVQFLVGDTIGFRFSLIDTITGKARSPVEVNDPWLYIGNEQAISPDGKTLVAFDTSNRHEIRLLNSETGQVREKLSALQRPIHTYVFSPDGRYIAAASGRDQSGENAQLAAPSEIVIWDVATGKELARLVDKESIRDYTALRFSPDGAFVVAQETGGAFSFWGNMPKPKEEPVAKAKAKEKPPAPTAVPDRFQSLFQNLSADGVTDQRRVEGVFLAALGRLPTDVESRTLAAQIARQTDKAAALRDLLNTLVSTDEFKTHVETLGKLAK